MPFETPWTRGWGAGWLSRVCATPDYTPIIHQYYTLITQCVVGHADYDVIDCHMDSASLILDHLDGVRLGLGPCVIMCNTAWPADGV